MSYDARIARMRDQGLISEDQASRLSRALSFDGAPSAPKDEPRRKAGGSMLAVAAVLLAVVGALFLFGGGPETADVTQDVSQTLNQPTEIGNMSKSMQSGFSLALIVGIPLVLVIVWVAVIYNGLVTKEEAVFESWSQVESNYQRRADLIPNVLEAVSDYMVFEQETLGAIVQQRAEAQAGLPPDVLEDIRKTIEAISTAQEESSDVLGGIRGAPLDPEALQRLTEAQKALGTSMHRILALSENYPQLRSSDQVLALQAQLEGTENRINIARMRFNEAASEFNSAIRRMPASLIASVGDFRRKAYFTADAGANRPVEVSLD